MSEILTTTRNGHSFLAKLYKGEPTPVTYANLTQARKKAEALGEAWEVTGRRPYYVRRVGTIHLKVRIDLTIECTAPDLVYDCLDEILDSGLLQEEIIREIHDGGMPDGEVTILSALCSHAGDPKP